MNDFDCTLDEFKKIYSIADRFEKESSQNYPRQTMVMDLAACHRNGCPLDFARLLDAPTFDFMHDVIGIANHIDRATGKLTDCFLPRYAQVCQQVG